MNNEPFLSLEEAKKAVAEKTNAPRVTEDSIKAKIKEVSYIGHGVLTICIITMENGFYVVGVSAPASEENYLKNVGERYAYDNAFKQLWQLEGYLLKEQLNSPSC